MIVPAFIIIFLGGAALGSSRVLDSRLAHYTGLLFITLGTFLALTSTFS